MFRRRKKIIDVDDVLVDAFNLPEFSKESLEGRFSLKINPAFVLILFFVFASALAVFVYTAFKLQIKEYSKYAQVAAANITEASSKVPVRGVIEDRYGRKLAYNGALIKDLSDENTKIYKREYARFKGIAHVLGYIKYPAKDKKGVFWRDNYEGVGGVEEYFNDKLNGKPGKFAFTKDATGKIISTQILSAPKDGENITLSIDAKLSELLYETIKRGVQKSKFQGGAGVVLDIETGEVLALVSYPEYNNQKMSDMDKDYIKQVLKDKNKPLLNRAISGEYTPGSVVKPMMALAALKEGIIKPSDKILSTGALKIPNPYKKGEFYVFKDWKAHGLVNMKEAIAHSSDEYFYKVGGGYKDIKGLGIERIKKYAKLFGFTEKTGIELPSEKPGLVPDPNWKKSTFGERWTIGNTYHTAIGQYGFLVTAIQIGRYVAALANYGKLFKPTILKDKKTSFQKLDFSKDEFNVIHDGMRMAVTIGTAKSLNMKDIEIAAKTGTAELGMHKEYMNSWVMGFWPYKQPKFAFAVVLEKAPAHTLFGAAPTMRYFFEELKKNFPYYAKGRYPSKNELEKRMDDKSSENTREPQE